jgi:hypothetical protein
MKKEILFSIAFVMLLVGCKKEIKETPTVPIAEEVIPDEPKLECYLYDESGNAISVQLSYNENNVSGSLTYALKEKDSNNGVFVGQIKDNILIADYTFLSEGTKSKRQIAFQIKDNQLLQGYGEMNEDGTKFKDVAKLKFNATMPLKKQDCPK